MSGKLLKLISIISTMKLYLSALMKKDDLNNINDILEIFAKSCNHSDSLT